MKTTVTERENNAALLEVEISPEEVASSLDAATAKLQREIRLPGFRKGKVPKALIVQRFGIQAIAAEMLEDRLPEWSQKAIEQSGLEAIDIIEPAHFEEGPEHGRPFSFHLKVQLLPKAQLGQYKGLEVPRETAEVTDEEVDRQVERLREEFATLRPVSGRPAQKGDLVTVDLSGSVDGQPVEGLSAEDYALEVGAGRVLAELEEGIEGMTVGEEKEITVVYPEDWRDPEFAGKTAVFSVRMKEIKEKVLPPLNDEFAKDVSEFATLLELRMDIRSKLKSSKESFARSRFRAAAVKQAVDNATVELPEVLVNRQLESMMEDYLRSLEARGVDVRKFINENEEALRAVMERSRPEAEQLVKTSLVLDAVAEAEGLSVTEEDIAEVVQSLASASNVEPAVMREQLERSGRIQSIRQNLLRDKAVDLIEASSVPVEPEASEATQVSEEDTTASEESEP